MGVGQIKVVSEGRVERGASAEYPPWMYRVRQTAEFANWFDGLRDLRAKQRVEQRIARLAAGLFGDVKFFDGIGELRIDYGPGYRIYFIRRGSEVILLLCGGDKSSQNRDIRKAISLAKEV